MKSIKLQEYGLFATSHIQLPKSNTNNNLFKLNSIKLNKILDNQSINQYLSNSINNQSSFINDVLIYKEVIDKEVIDITSATVCFDDNITTEYYAQYPLFFINRNIIKIPKKSRICH